MKTGIVTKSTGSWFEVESGNCRYECKIKGKFRIKGIKATNPLAVGDIVDFQTEENSTVGVISAIHERKNYIVRKATKLSKKVHVIAANIDIAWLVVTLAYPETTTIFIDRFLTTAQAYRVKVNLVFNKTDLYTEQGNEYLEELIEIYSKIGYECYKVSALKKQNIDVLRKKMDNQVNVISGHSGVGKSTLINAIDPKLKLRIGEMSEYHQKGKHTTTFAEMFSIDSGGKVIDTPGIKAFGIIDMEKEEITHFFPEMFALMGQCRYYNCTHTHEPGCAVKQAVEENKIAASRYRSYIDLFLGDDDKYRSSS